MMGDTEGQWDRSAMSSFRPSGQSPVSESLSQVIFLISDDIRRLQIHKDLAP